MRTLQKLTIKNYKSIHEQTLELGQLNIFIGGNGVGKSNLISAFRLLREIVTQNLAGYTAIKGGADNLLYFGRKISPEMSFFLEFGEGNTSNSYKVILRGTDEDKFTVWNETVYYHEKTKYPQPYDQTVTHFADESELKSAKHICAVQAMRDLESYRVYHFHDTSDTAAVKAACDLEDNIYLRPQAENLAAFLYWLKIKKPDHFSNIEDTVRQIAPFFDSFQLTPSRLNETRIRLEWKEKGSDTYFNATAFSDGTLRFICLATLLLQPNLPSMVLLDEPELGLHPAAVALLADLLSSAATRTQVLVSTQSVTLVNQFEPADVWTVDRKDNQSVFRHLNDVDMSNWLDEYGLGDLWEKNRLGGRP
ncbi:ABC transport protein [Collimonas arenae]|uniref:ABC transport protein n=1 Tax=Collimonas arenae TaxID=279058 RepID=A0A0A1FJH3_9BURK|nr:AAA family ATPase [Collimonas arenae]AIY43870.1 ABC transport protein [Collimonas arenae]